MASIVKYRLAIIYGILFTFNSLASSVIVAFEHVSFKDLVKEDWIMIVSGIALSWTGTMLAFVSKAMHVLPPDPQQPQPPKNI